MARESLGCRQAARANDGGTLSYQKIRHWSLPQKSFQIQALQKSLS
jgi:hypothetical protein